MFKTAKIYWSYLSSAKDVVVLALLAFATMGFFLVSQSSSAQGARDCDNNAILNCGAYSISELKQKYDSANSEARGAFNHFAVDRSEFDNLVEGHVHSNNTVTVGGKVVATNAKTSGRQFISGSDFELSSGAWVRSPSVSFRSSSLQAYVRLENGVFKYAIIKSCGNPTGGTATEAGKVSLTQGKTTSPAANSQVQVGQTIHYQMTVKNTGNIEARTASISDTIPAGTDYVANSFETIGSTPRPDLFDFDGTRLLAAWDRVPAGGERTIKFRVTVNAGVTDGDDICNIAVTDAQEVEPQQTNQVCHEIERPTVQVCDPATGEIITVSKDQAGNYKPVGDAACDTTTEPEPFARCTNLAASPLSGTAPLTVRFTASIDKSDDVSVTAVVFNFGEGNSNFVNDAQNINNPAVVQNLYENPGTYTARVTQVRTNKGNFNVPNNSSCKVVIRPSTQPVTSNATLTCVGLFGGPTSGVAPHQVDFTAVANRTNGARVVRYEFDFDNNGSVDRTVNSGDLDSANASHTYTTAGQKTAKVYVVGTVPSGNSQTTERVSSTNCEATITVTAQVTPVAQCDSLTAKKLNDLQFEFTLRASAQNGAMISAYTIDYGDGTVITTDLANDVQTLNTNTTHTYDQVATVTNRTAKLTVDTTEGSKTSSQCGTTVTLNPPASFSCVELVASPNKGEAPLEVVLSVTAAANNTQILGYGFDLDGDGDVDETINTDDLNATLNHTFNEDSTVRVFVVSVDEEISAPNPACVEDIEVEKEEEPEFVCTGLSREDIDRNTKKFTVTARVGTSIDVDYQFEVDGEALAAQNSTMLTRDFSDGSHTVRARLVSDSLVTSFADCVNEFSVTPDNPSELPNTGAAGMLSAFFGTTTLGQGLRIWLGSRKKLLGALLSN